MIAIEDLRRFAVTRSLFPPATLMRAVERLGFIQADPIRAPARAQDLPAEYLSPPRDRAGRLSRISALIDLVVRQHAPLPAASGNLDRGKRS